MRCSLDPVVVWIRFRTEGKTGVDAMRCRNRLLEQRDPALGLVQERFSAAYSLFCEDGRMP